MNIAKIGALIKQERIGRDISRTKLTAGVCSETSLRRIEAGERHGDFFILERLISRLGSSINKMDIIQDEADYRLFVLKEIIKGELSSENYDGAEESLAECESLADKENTLQCQYLETMKGIISSEKYRDFNKADEHFNHAINLTLPGISAEKMNDYIIGEEELIIILLYLKNKEKMGEDRIGRGGRDILNYIDTHFSDEEVKCSLYGRAARIIGDSFIKNGKYEEALTITLAAEDRLAGNGMLQNLPQLLDRILFLSEGRNEPVYADFKKMRDALKDLYEEYDVKWKTKDISLITDCKQKNIYIMSEFIKQERMLKGISRQELSAELDIDIKTISRIETGKTSPKKETLRKLLEYFDKETEMAESRIITNDFRLLEMEREVAKLNTFQRYEEAEVLYRELKREILLEHKRNAQYVKLMDVQFDRIMKRCTPDEAIERLTDAFNITRGDTGLAGIGKFVLSKAEATIINNIAVCYKMVNRQDKSIELLEKAALSYGNSRIDLKYRYVPLALIYSNLCAYYEETDQFDKALELADKTIRYSIECLRGDFLGFMLEEKTYTLDRMTGDNSKSRQRYRQSYQLRRLMKASERQKAPIERAFKEWYGEDIR
jgi:hypothetical protein